MKHESAIISNPPFANNYARDFLGLEYGKGAYLFDLNKKRYLDFGAGIAVNSLGYGRKDLAKTAFKQMKKLIHTSNLYTSQPVVDLAKKLVALGNFQAVHFGNSGTEANEAALKYARIYSLRTKGPGNHKLLSFTNAFHGRTMGSLSVTPNELYSKGCEPLLADCTVLAYNDVNALQETLDSSYAAVIVEPLQGEGGLELMTAEFARALNQLCRKHDVILIADEVQTGLGRLGSVFGSSICELEPDIITLAKPLAAGLPLSATLIPAKINEKINVGEHGTTFGGGPVTTAVAGRVLDILTKRQFLDNVKELASTLEDRLEELAAVYSSVSARHGAGLLQGIAIAADSSFSAADVISTCRDQGLLVLKSGKDRVRIAPPLTISEKELECGVAILEKVLKQLSK